MDNFRYSYNKLIRKDIISLNLYHKLYIVIDKEFFVYDIETNKITKINELIELHTLGGLVFVQNKIFCLSGRETSSTEFFVLDRKTKNRVWETYHPLSKSRALFSTFIQNQSIIYIIFGYNYIENNYLCESLERSDILMNSRWSNLKICFKNIISPKLILSSTLIETENCVLILGIG
jgi:hypothetical protein